MIARVQWVFSHSAGPPAALPAGSPPNPTGSLSSRLLVTPVVTLWNPYNIIGSSDATPLIPANAVVNSNDAGPATNLQYDDACCANHVLFNDWFSSSIAAGSSNGFGKASVMSLQKPYTDFISEVAPLPNRQYKPLPEDAAFARIFAANANTLCTKNVNDANAWKSPASRLEVEGMFNVDSTSVTAWRALLGHAREQQTPCTDAVGDVKAGSPGVLGGFSAPSEFAGYRQLDAELLDAFAQKIVDQVRLRGPFLFLSEFINRQLSSGDLALAGTIPAALKAIAKDTSANFHSGVVGALDAPAGKKFALADPEPRGTSKYKFPAAAEGISVYGVPGWTRQADIMRPLAPILSARDDTFVIRAYGDSRDAADKVVARAACEVTVRRSRNYCDPAEAADLSAPPVCPINKNFVRRFETVSFRWLSPAEI